MMRLRSIAWIALLATLFSAASPTLAAWILADRPDALGQMLGLPAEPSKVGDAQGHRDHVEHAAAHPEASDSHAPPALTEAADEHHDGSHQSHSIFCSLCLNPSSLATVAPLPPTLWLLGLQFDIARPEPHSTPSASFLPLYRSRAPPPHS